VTPQDPATRAAYRAFVRANHPDRGGDPEAFVAGLARFREPAARPAGVPDPPVEVVPDLPFPVRVAVALVRTVRRHRRTRVDRPAPDHPRSAS
jgi:hypothetical protein